MNKKKEYKWFMNINFYGWIITWFLAIWILKFRVELFLTGFFMFFLAIIFVDSNKKKS